MYTLLRAKGKWIILGLTVLLTACSVEKNTPLSVSYHNMLAHYNIHFNGNESFQKGVHKVSDGYEDDFSQILPVYILPDENAAGSILPDMDRTQKKAMKVIEMHSIKAKREYKKGEITPKQREYLKKNEYNKWVDDSYMLIGKSYFYQKNYSLSLETFRFILREFEGDPITYEAKLWIAKAHIEQEEYKEALNILNDLDGVRKINDKLKSEINAVFCNYYIQQEDYANAIPKLKKSLKKPGSKLNKMRYTFILAQLYERTGANSKAYDLYHEVIKMNPPYEMTFNAKINMAGAFEKGHANSSEIKEELYKMLKDDKNLDFRDQIYYAIAEIDMKEGTFEDAINNYKLSLNYSVSNIKQKARAYITLADIFYDMPSYRDAQAYYDSAFIIIDEEFPDYEIIKAKSSNLTELVNSIKAVELQDSVQYLASLSSKERLDIIDQIIADLEQKEREDQLLEQQRLQQMNADRMMSVSGMSNASRTTGWYFYNPTAKSFGQKEFKTRWGIRKLEDNWRRKNKKTVMSDQYAFDQGSDTENSTAEELSKKSREYYLQNIPLTDSAMRSSHNIIKESLINMGLIYKNQFNETEMSIQAFEELIRRYPDDEISLNGYYNLFLIFRESNQEKANRYKNEIISGYSDSKFAKVLTDPEYYKEIEKQEKEIPMYYEQTLNLFNQERYPQVINNADYALNKYKESDLATKFRYLKTLSIGKTKDPLSFRNALNDYINGPNDAELIASARKILFFLDNERPEIKEVAETEIANEIYGMYPESEHYVIISVNSSANINQLSFNVIDYNLENFDDLNLSVENLNLSPETKIIKIGKFKNQSSIMQYYDNIKGYGDIFRDVNDDKANIYFISLPNYLKLIEDKNNDRYVKFFEGNF